MRIILLIFICLSLTGCADLLMLSSGASAIGSQNVYVKAYNGVDMLTIASTKKDIKQHAYNKITKKSSDTSKQLKIITQELQKLNTLNQEVNLKLDRLSNKVIENKSNMELRLIDLETNKFYEYVKNKYYAFLAFRKHNQSYIVSNKSPRQLVIDYQRKLKRQKEKDDL
mgnify:FL=1